ncbi:MAG: asparaginase, partial [Gemmatimonadales bacterium]
SALKPFQALPTVEDGAAEAFGFGVEEIALACASHGGRPEHVLGVRRMLAALGIEEASLHCGPHSPYDHDTEVAIECGGGAPGRVHNNCSGKHAALIALARHHGWEVDGYWRLDHPVQRRIRERLADWIDTDPERLVWGTDGCGVPTPRLSLAEMALAYARFGRAAARDEPGPAAVVAAMTSRPELTSSPGREPLRIMQATDGRLLAKEGAEGVICLAAPADGWGLALKVEDGTRRAVGPGAIGVLAAAGLITDEERARLADLEVQPVMATTGERVGELRAVIDGAEDG